jgi:carbamoyl-phosphate synthase small subunit
MSCPVPPKPRSNIIGIFFRDQLLPSALGATTYKLEWGHCGANQSVKDPPGRSRSAARTMALTSMRLRSGERESDACLAVQRLERGDRVNRSPAFSVLSHPGASRGPTDNHYLFHRFFGMMERRK